MLRALDDPRDDDAGEIRADAIDAFDFVADHVQALDQRVVIGADRHAFAQPIFRNLHRLMAIFWQGTRQTVSRNAHHFQNARKSVTP
jgi:hypothetical protein